MKHSMLSSILGWNRQGIIAAPYHHCWECLPKIVLGIWRCYQRQGTKISQDNLTQKQMYPLNKQLRASLPLLWSSKLQMSSINPGSKFHRNCYWDAEQTPLCMTTVFMCCDYYETLVLQKYLCSFSTVILLAKEFKYLYANRHTWLHTWSVLCPASHTHTTRLLHCTRSALKA